MRLKSTQWSKIHDILKESESKIRGVTGHLYSIEISANINPMKDPDLEPFLDEVCLKYGINKKALRGPSRRRGFVELRSAISYVLREDEVALTSIGKLLNRNHTTIMNSIEKFKEDKIRNPELNHMLKEIKSCL